MPMRIRSDRDSAKMDDSPSGRIQPDGTPPKNIPLVDLQAQYRVRRMVIRVAGPRGICYIEI